MAKYNLTPLKLIKLLRKNGFYFTRQSGSHAIFTNDITGKKVVVPVHSRDIPKGTLNAIIKDSGIEM
jgi:mRNA interferase HicA